MALITKLHASGGLYDFRWRLFQTPVTAAHATITDGSGEMGLGLEQILTTYTFDVVNVSLYSGIRIMCYGTDTDNYTGTMNLFGWMDDGPPSHIGSVALTLGNATACASAASSGFHQHASTHSSIRSAFAAATTYLAVDTYASTDYEDALTDRNFTNEPGWLELDLARSQYQWVAGLFSGIGGGGTQMTSLGAIYRPLANRERGVQLA